MRRLIFASIVALALTASAGPPDTQHPVDTIDSVMHHDVDTPLAAVAVTNAPKEHAAPLVELAMETTPEHRVSPEVLPVARRRSTLKDLIEDSAVSRIHRRPEVHDVEKISRG